MEEPKDFSLLDDEDEAQSSPTRNDFKVSNSAMTIPAVNKIKIQTNYNSNQYKINPVSKFNISPNKPNVSNKLELKSIDRPRSHSPLKMSGIEEYVKMYKRNSIDNNSEQTGLNKITMNLRMDDILANKNESSSYQMLSDFSILTGDTTDDFKNSNKTKSRKQSLDILGFDEQQNKNIDDLDDDDLDEEEQENDKQKEKTNFNYKFTAVYKKDETTGAFEEKSKIVFEAKNSEISKPIPTRPPPPPRPAATGAKSQLESALEQLKSNSNNLESKLDKLDDITPSSNSYYDSSTPTESNNKDTIKKKNDSFFNEFLTKSDDLIAQTQNKLERLSKLETVTKPFAPLAQTTPPPPKPKPVPSQFLPNETNKLEVNLQSINSSKSLIDLKSNEVSIEQVSQAEPTPIQNTQVDLLFDLNSELTLATEPIKQGESYFDLIGLTKPQTSIENNLNSNEIKLNADLLKLTETEADSGALSTSPFKDDLLELMTASNELKNKEQAPNINSPNLNIDILITEPLHESDENNVVPDGYFDLKHEIPKDQSRPQSPINPQDAPTRSRPVSPLSRTISPRPPSPAVAKSRPSSPKEIQIKDPIPEIEPEIKIKKTEKSKIKKRIWTQENSQGESVSSSSSEDEVEQKFQVRIRPKASLNKNPNEQTKPTFIPLLPKPPKSAEEIEEFRQRRRSSDTGSITRSIKDDSSSSEEIEIKKPEIDQSERKESIKSEFNLELPDEDDSLPLSDFNEKYELTKYSDGTYGCMVLVRQPFRNPNVMYKNAIQKMTEVRSWTECLVRLVDSDTGGKKLVFYNTHELMTLAAEHDTTIENIIEKSVINIKNTKQEELNDNEKALKKISPFHEIDLKMSYKFTDLCLQQFDNYSKIHTFKIQDILFKETIQIRPDRLIALPERFFKRFTKPKVTSLLDHTPLPFEICKFGHLSYSYLRSFLMLLQDAFWSLPTLTRKKQREEQLQQIQQQPVTTAMSITSAAASLFSLGSNKPIQAPSLTSVTATHTREEITVKVVDEYKCKLDKECRIKEHKSRTRVYLTAFLNASDPVIEIGINDVLRHGKEIVGRHDIIPIKTEQWISPELFEINEKVVDKEEFEKTHCLRCVQMPDNLLVEIMRFRTRPRRNYELPLQVRSFMSLIGRQVEIRIECTVAGTYFTNLSDVYCQDIQIRFPLPDVWVYLFRVEKMFRYGALHSTKSKLGKIKGLDRLLVHKSGQQAAFMEASCGLAKYEQAFKSLVWRIEQLPVKNKDIYKTQLFVCKLNLQEYDNLPDKYEELAQVQYSIPICASSKCQVRSVSVDTCEDPPEKWAKLKSKFEYDLDINYVFDQQELPSVNKQDFAETNKIELNFTQTESEGDNNEADDD